MLACSTGVGVLLHLPGHALAGVICDRMSKMHRIELLLRRDARADWPCDGVELPVLGSRHLVGLIVLHYLEGRRERHFIPFLVDDVHTAS